eukprot:2258020-Amphidinium_carterae.1
MWFPRTGKAITKGHANADDLRVVGSVGFSPLNDLHVMAPSATSHQQQRTVQSSSSDSVGSTS